MKKYLLFNFILCMFLLTFFISGCTSNENEEVSYEQIGKEYVSEYLNQVYCEDTSYDFSVVKGANDSGDVADSPVVRSKYTVDNNEYTVYVNVDSMKVYTDYYKADIETQIKDFLKSKLVEQNIEIDVNAYKIEYSIYMSFNNKNGNTERQTMQVVLNDVYLSDITPVNVKEYIDTSFGTSMIEMQDDCYMVIGKDEYIKLYK